MTSYASYMPTTPTGQYRAYHCRTSTPAPNRYEHETQQRSPFPRAGTPAPAVRGKSGISSYIHSQRFGLADGPRPHCEVSSTHSWVLEQDCLRKERMKQTKKTQQWVFEQRTLFPGETLHSKDDLPPAWEEKTRDHMWAELVYSYELEADRWRKQEEEVRRIAAERERRKARYVQKELMRARREMERQKMVDEKLRMQLEARERYLKEQANAQKAITDAWGRYENGWEAIARSAAPLGFADIPWPTKSIPTTISDITPSTIVTLLLSPFHPQKQTRKERLRSAQPDRFRKLMGRIRDEDKKAVEEGVGIISRCLNDLMSKEKTLVSECLRQTIELY